MHSLICDRRLGAQSKKRPPDNDSTVVMSQGQKTRNMQWEFHDDKC